MTKIRDRKITDAEAANGNSPNAPYCSNTGRAKMPISCPPLVKEKSVDNKSKAGRSGNTKRTLSTLSN
jgi:hypothetical protein